MAKAKKSIQALVADALTKKSELDLNEEQLNLLRLCRLLVDISHKSQAYKEKISEQAK